MDSLVAIHQLRDDEVHSNARKHVGVFAAEALLHNEKIDHLPRSQPSRFRQILKQSHGDVMRGRFRARPPQPLALAHVEFESSILWRFKRGDIHFAVSLRRMAVAHLE